MTLPQLDEARPGWEPQPAAAGESPAAAVSAPAPQKACDPLAVAVGNASLFGVGYVMLGWRWVAVATTAITVLLVAILAVSVQALWLEIIVGGWWLALVAHGWRLARKRPQRRPVGKPRLVAGAVALPVLLVFGLVRFDAAGIEGDADQARADGDCAQALAALDQLWVGHDIVNAPLTARGDDTMRACDLLTRSAHDLDAALGGDIKALEPAFGRFTFVLDNLPGHNKMVQTTLDGFLDRLPTKRAGCRTLSIVDWLRERHAGGPLRRATTIVSKIAPDALLNCGDELLKDTKWQDARSKYQRLLDQYPDNKLAAKATQGVKQATLGLELSTVRQLLSTPTSAGLPAYCDSPAPYSAAPAWRATAPNRALIYGDSTYSSQIPAPWKATDPSNATTVICAEDPTYGGSVETCPYTSETGVSGWVSFHKIAIPMEIYEVRTGRLISRTVMEIGGVSCPPVITWSYYGVDLGPPSQMYVAPATADIHAAFTPVIFP